MSDRNRAQPSSAARSNTPAKPGFQRGFRRNHSDPTAQAAYIELVASALAASMRRGGPTGDPRRVRVDACARASRVRATRARGRGAGSHGSQNNDFQIMKMTSLNGEGTKGS